MSKKLVWHKGNPPYVGWWFTVANSKDIYGKSWRWWDGEKYSIGFLAFEYDSNIEMLSDFKVNVDVNIRYSDYWPENARVPRIDPRKRNKK